MEKKTQLFYSFIYYSMPNIEILKLIKLEKQQVTWLVLTVSGSSAFSVVPFKRPLHYEPGGGTAK